MLARDGPPDPAGDAPHQRPAGSRPPCRPPHPGCCVGGVRGEGAKGDEHDDGADACLPSRAVWIAGPHASRSSFQIGSWPTIRTLAAGAAVFVPAASSAVMLDDI